MRHARARQEPRSRHFQRNPADETPAVVANGEGILTKSVMKDVAHVLIAASDDPVRDLCERQLTAAGLRVTFARTGFEAIVKASCQLPDLILLHRSLGLGQITETTRLLASCPVTAHIPIVRLKSQRGGSRQLLETLSDFFL
jgi:CheY-like chemotaxis protein